MANDISRRHVYLVLRLLPNPSRTIAKIIFDRVRNLGWWHHLRLWGIVSMVALFSIHHGYVILIDLVRTQVGVTNFAISSGFCETSTIVLTFFSCYMNSILEQSSFSVEFFGLVGNNSFNG